MRPMLIALLALTLVPAPAAAQEGDLSKLADLEALVHRVEEQGFKRLKLEKLRPRAPEGLAFAVQGNTVEKEREFRRAWIQAYDGIGKELAEQAKPIVKDKKDPGARDVKRLLDVAAPRIQEVRSLAAKPAENETFAAREATLRKFLKRYDYGPKIARAEAAGTAVINVAIAPDIYEVVRRHVYAWKFQPLKDEKGADAKFGKYRIEYTDQMMQNEVREALRMLSNEYFAVRYARLENEKETDIIRITGAKLLLGTYYFLEHEDRLVVIREPAPAGK